jgi:hypothetical protein
MGGSITREISPIFAAVVDADVVVKKGGRKGAFGRRRRREGCSVQDVVVVVVTVVWCLWCGRGRKKRRE